jgi:tRNA pseudouridine55 synthase
LQFSWRLIQYVQRMPKRYVGTFLLGRQSPTEDIEGEVTELPDAPVPTREQIAAVAQRFVGRVDQRPPAFSALKVAGRRAYKLARQGRQPELAARPVEIRRIEVRAYEYPELVLDVECGSGTYIRSLGRDLAESLCTAAVMSGLVRTAIGGFRIEDAVDPDGLNRDDWLRWLLPPLRAVACLPRVQLSADEAERIRNGLAILLRGEGRGERGEERLPLAVSHETDASQEFAAIDPAGQLVGILATGRPGELRTVRNMPVL